MAVPPWPTDPPRHDPASSEPWGRDPWTDEPSPSNHPWTAEPVVPSPTARLVAKVTVVGLGCGAVAALVAFVL